MKILLLTPLPRFANELCDVLKLFGPVEAFAVEATAPQTAEDAVKAQYTATPATADMEKLLHEFAAADGLWRCRFTLRGEAAERTLAVPAGDALVRKRALKRLCKLTLYDLCAKLTGGRPPWGSLTGIRPTRLIYEKLAQGMTLDAAANALTSEFDVRPEKAALLARIVAVQQSLPAPAPDEADVYVSIPFCRTRCSYCSFPGEALGKGMQVKPYLAALFSEMEAAARLMGERGLRLRALYVGGGTPTALYEEAFRGAHGAAGAPLSRLPRVYRGGGPAGHHHPRQACRHAPARRGPRERQPPDHERRDPPGRGPGPHTPRRRRRLSPWRGKRVLTISTWT